MIYHSSADRIGPRHGPRHDSQFTKKNIIIIHVGERSMCIVFKTPNPSDVFWLLSLGQRMISEKFGVDSGRPLPVYPTLTKLLKSGIIRAGSLSWRVKKPKKWVAYWLFLVNTSGTAVGFPLCSSISAWLSTTGSEFVYYIDTELSNGWSFSNSISLRSY